MRHFLLIIVLYTGFVPITLGQVYIGSESVISGNGNIKTNMAVTDNSSGVTLGKLSFEGNDTISIQAEWLIDSLIVNGDLVLEGNSMKVHNSLNLSGILTPTEAMMLIMDTAVSITHTDGSYVNGKLIHAGSGNKFFPIGKEGQYAPSYLIGLENTQKEWVGMQVFNETINIPNLPSTVKVSQSWYWEITGTPTNARAQLPIMQEDLESLGANEELTILNTDLDLANLKDQEGLLVNEGNALLSSQPISLGYLLFGINGEPLSLNKVSDRVQAYPNPFEDFIILQLPLKNRPMVSIYDMSGALVFEDYYNGELTVNTSTWIPGIYLLTASTPQKIIYKKLLKVK